MRSCSTLFALCFASVVYAAIGPRANIFIENKVIAPDGFSRSTVLAGASRGAATFPGPIISGKKGDTFSLNVINELTDNTMLKSTSIHWHGLFQKRTAWADGPVGVTQCPIIPGNSFNYQFTALDQAGTFWYHSHYSTQYCDGLRGAMVVYDPNDPYKSQYDVDDDSTVITLADWYRIVAPILGNSTNPPESNTTLINGLGRNKDNVTLPLAVISVKYNKRYRFRLVSISCDPSFNFSIDGHNMTIIEVDGVNVKPLIVDSVEIHTGQRYSFILSANQSNSSYWIRADPSIGEMGFKDGINSAILLYDGAHDKVPNTIQKPSVIPLLETNLHPLTNPAAPGPPVPAAESKGQVLSIPYNITFSSNPRQFFVNNATFTPPTVPVLLQILSGAHTAHELLPKGSVYTLPPNKVIEITIPGGTTAAPHPIHLHGHAFSVVRSAGSTVYNYKNPVRRDVVNTGTELDDLVVIRFETDNAGPWIMHCHIDWHLDLGLAIVMAEDVKGISQLNPPVAWDKLCPAFNHLPPQTFP